MAQIVICETDSSLKSGYSIPFLPGEQAMEERWRKLCEQAAAETDPDRLMELIAEINKLLEEREARMRSLQSQKSGKPTPDSPPTDHQD